MSLGVEAAAVRNPPVSSPLSGGAGSVCVCTVRDGPALGASGDDSAVSTAALKGCSSTETSGNFP